MKFLLGTNTQVLQKIKETQQVIEEEEYYVDFVNSTVQRLELGAVDEACADCLSKFRLTLATIKSEPCVDINVCEMYSPVRKSFANLDKAWNQVVKGTLLNFFTAIKEDVYANPAPLIAHLNQVCETAKVSKEIANMHFNNLQIIFSPEYEQLCIKKFESVDDLVQKKRINPGFILAIYNDPRFQSRYFQLLLLAINVTAILIAIAIANVTLLPVAVAAVVASLPKFAFGAAVTVAAATTITLAASLHARFFNNRPPAGGASGGSVELTPREPERLKLLG
ncbi:MAG: hypothetical protein ACO1N3_03865 [Gammaproteobacteria bacterium]